MTCATCDTALVMGPRGIDVSATSAALIDRVADGRMLYLRGDVPLKDMIPLAMSDMKYTIVSFLECLECSRTRFWGLSIRGAPIYKVVDADAPARWPWDAVPPRSAWAPEA